MRDSQQMKDEKAFVENALGKTEICARCKATLATYADACTADLSDACPGFMAIEQCREHFAHLNAIKRRVK